MTLILRRQRECDFHRDGIAAGLAEAILHLPAHATMHATMPATMQATPTTDGALGVAAHRNTLPGVFGGILLQEVVLASIARNL